MNMFFSGKIRQLWQTIWSLPALVALVLTLSLIGGINPTFAAHDTGLFELDVRAGVEGDQDKKNDPFPPLVGDGNTTDDAAVGVDWENIYCDAVGSALCAVPASGAAVISWIEDTFANNPINSDAEAFVGARTPEDTFFTGGGSKDTNGIQDGPWKYKIQSDQVPDKNDIVNAFAADYENGTTYLFFGLDTFSVNGAANAGFWFFRDRIGLNPPNARGIGTFSGVHRDGDIFIAVAYTQGGRVGDIDVYEWDGDDATGSLLLINSGQDCATVGAGDPVCGVINKLLPDDTFGEDPIFDYANTLVANNPDILTDPTSYQYESAAFVEFGMDVEAVIGRPLGCISSFLAETRSSQSETAQLKDFAFGNFDVCSIGVTKTGDTLSKVGDDVDYEIVVTNTGQTTLYKQSISDTLLGDLASHCGPSLDPGASCTINVTRTVLAGDADPLPNTVTIVYTEFADPLSLSLTDSASHSVNLFQPSVTLAKTGDDLSKVGDEVDYTITVTNTSSADTPNLSCTISDALLGLNKAVNLAPGASDVTNTSRTVLAGDVDPLINTASVACTVDGFDNILNASDDHSVDLFQPNITLDKTGDALSKVGDEVDYTITLNNTSSAGTPDLTCTITDGLLGINEGVNLASGGSHVINASRTVLAGDADPLINTAEVLCTVDGFGNVLEASDDHSVNLFQPSIDLDKTGDELSKVGDDVNYVITVTNTSSPDTPYLECTITDALLSVAENVTLTTINGIHVINTSRTVLAGDVDPLINEADVVCIVDGFGNVLEASDDHTVNLFQPSIALDKTGDDLSKVGDDVDYTITVNNTSSADTPDLTCTITDTLLGLNKGVSLASGDNDVTNTSRTVQGGDPDPLVNLAEVSCTVDGFGNLLEASDDHTVNLFQPNITLDKTGDDLSKVGDDVNYVITVNNTSSADTPDLSCTITDTLLSLNKNVSLASGANDVTNATRTVDAIDPDPLLNTADVSCTVDGFGNVVEASDDHSVNLFQPGIALDKTGDTLSKVGDDVEYVITLSNTSSADTPNLTCTISDAMLGVNAGVNLVSGGNHVIGASRTVLAGDPDPLTNIAVADCTVDGFGNLLSATDDHSVNLFQPSITLDKTGDTLSKVGDDVGYVITLNNTSSADTPNLTCTISDTLLSINAGVNLASGGGHVINASRTVQGGDPDPLVNIAAVDCTVDGFGNLLSASDGHTVELFQPDYSLSVSCPAQLPAAGDELVYSLTINNNSSADSPDLQRVSDIKTIIFDPLGIPQNIPLVQNGALPASLASGDSATIVVFSGTTIAAGAYKGMANATYSPVGFPNQLPRDAMDTCEILAPAPALIILEKLLRNGEGTPFTYDTTGGVTSTDILTPAFNNTTEIAASPFDQTFDAASNGFDRMDGAISVPIPTTTSTVTVMVEELIPEGIDFENLECTINRDGSRDSDIVIGGTLGEKATLTLGDLDTAECRWTNVRPGGVCVVIIDEETIDNDIHTIEDAAFSHGKTPDWLINDDRPTEVGNPWLRWNEQFPGDVVLLPGGQIADEGWYALPDEIRYMDNVVSFPFNDIGGNFIANSQDWVESFVNGMLPQDKLDKILDVMPLRDPDLLSLVGQTCVAVVYDSDISMNYDPLNGNLQGARYGLFAFTVDAVEVPGSIPESQSSTSLYDLWLTVEPPTEFTQLFNVTPRDQIDSVAITRARYSRGVLTVFATSELELAQMWVSVDGADAGSDPDVAPFILNDPMIWNEARGRFEYELNTPVNLDGRRITVYTTDGAYNDYIQ